MPSIRKLPIIYLGLSTHPRALVRDCTVITHPAKTQNPTRQLPLRKGADPTRTRKKKDIQPVDSDRCHTSIIELRSRAKGTTRSLPKTASDPIEPHAGRRLAATVTLPSLAIVIALPVWQGLGEADILLRSSLAIFASLLLAR